MTGCLKINAKTGPPSPPSIGTSGLDSTHLRAGKTDKLYMKSAAQKILTVFVTISGCLVATAQEIVIVDVKRNITLADSAPVYRDFYLNAGDGSSLRKNMVVTVKRKINVRDSASKSVGEFDTIVGQLKVIHVGNKVSVAREYKLQSRDSEPMLEQIGIMTGDKIDLTGAYIDNKPPTKPVTAQASLPPEVSAVTPDTAAEAEQRTPAAAEEAMAAAPAAPTTLKAIPIPQL